MRYDKLENNRRIDKIKRFRSVDRLKCSICPPNKGCNSGYKFTKNWKKFRKTKYKPCH